MPIKRRASKRRIGVEAELAAWSGLFECGHDYFDDVQDLTGLREPVHVWPAAARAKAEAAWLAAAQEAWRRLGPAFMARWEPDEVRAAPWALEAFGEPPCP